MTIFKLMLYGVTGFGIVVVGILIMSLFALLEDWQKEKAFKKRCLKYELKEQKYNSMTELERIAFKNKGVKIQKIKDFFELFLGIGFLILVCLLLGYVFIG